MFTRTVFLNNVKKILIIPFSYKSKFVLFFIKSFLSILYIIFVLIPDIFVDNTEECHLKFFNYTFISWAVIFANIVENYHLRQLLRIKNK